MYTIYVVSKTDPNDRTLIGERSTLRQVNKFLEAIEGRFNDDYEIEVNGSQGGNNAE